MSSWVINRAANITLYPDFGGVLRFLIRSATSSSYESYDRTNIPFLYHQNPSNEPNTAKHRDLFDFARAALYCFWFPTKSRIPKIIVYFTCSIVFPVLFLGSAIKVPLFPCPSILSLDECNSGKGLHFRIPETLVQFTYDFSSIVSCKCNKGAIVSLS